MIGRYGALALMCGAAWAGVAAPVLANNYRVVYSFQGGSDGANPQANLIEVGGLLYGTTSDGGSTNDCYGGCGTIFALDPLTGLKTVVHNFQKTDGVTPFAGLVYAGGMLYGVTSRGGPQGNAGTLFSLSPTTYSYTVLHAFNGSSSRSAPIEVHGRLYGTTESSIYVLDRATGHYRTLVGSKSIGGGPEGRLVDVDGALYGVTPYGGSTNCGTPGLGCGTVFSVDLASGAAKLVYSFQGGSDGSLPSAGLTEVGGLLYGTTAEGGGGRFEVGNGTVFALNPTTGAEQVLHAFQGDSDGSLPEASLTKLAGALQGTTHSGGSSTVCNGYFGCGTVFAVDPATGAEHIRHRFQGGSDDGAGPVASLISVAGTRYGTTESGGSSNCSGGCGTVFAITP